jgi:hypothetical protein
MVQRKRPAFNVPMSSVMQSMHLREETEYLVGMSVLPKGMALEEDELVVESSLDEADEELEAQAASTADQGPSLLMLTAKVSW